MGRRPIGKTAMTATERQRRWRAKIRRKKIWGANSDPSARRPTPQRSDNDFWPSPPEIQIALTRHVLPLLPKGPVWECAAGNGALVDALIRAGRRVVATDIDPQRSGIARLDFLADELPAATRGTVLATNPPFRLTDRFLGRALGLLDAGHIKGVALLFRGDQAATQERAADFNRARHELTITARTKWLPGAGGAEKSPRWWFTWITWLAGRDGPPVNRRITRTDLCG